MHHNLDANFSWAYMITTYINQNVFIYIFHKSLPTKQKIMEETYLCQYFSTWYQKFTSDLSMACIITGLTEVHYFVGGFLFILQMCKIPTDGKMTMTQQVSEWSKRLTESTASFGDRQWGEGRAENDHSKTYWNLRWKVVRKIYFQWGS